MLLSLPTDISLYILSFLPIHDLRSLLLVSHSIHAVIADNEATVYHQAAVFHNFVTQRTSLEDVKQSRDNDGVGLSAIKSWKELCRWWTILDRNWDGRGVVHEGGYRTPEDVLHFNIDEEENTLMTVSRTGGLAVRALEDNRVLWGLGKEHVFRSRCEVSHGFLLFNSKHQGLEIWRRSADAALHGGTGNYIATPVLDPSPSAALDFQISAARSAGALFPAPGSSNPALPGSLRGQYTPHAYLGLPFVHLVRIYRMHYPVLSLMSDRERNAVMLFDVRDGTMLRRVSFDFDYARIVGSPQGYMMPPVSDRVVMDLDVTGSHILICLHAATIVVRWQKYAGPPPTSYEELRKRDAEEETPPLMVLVEADIPQVVQDRALQLSRVASASATPASRSLPDTLHQSFVSVPVDGAAALQEFAVIPPPDGSSEQSRALMQMSATRVPPCFVSARFSPDGRHFAAVTVFGLLYLVSDFALVERNAVAFSEITKRVYMGEWLRDLVWGENQMRLVVQTASEEVYLVNLDTSLHRQNSEPASEAAVEIFPHLAVFRLTDFSNPHLGWARERGIAFSGVQMTRTALWMVWDLELLRRALGGRRHFVGEHTTDADADTDEDEDEDEEPPHPSEQFSILQLDHF